MPEPYDQGPDPRVLDPDCKTCAKPGPMVRVSRCYLAQVYCNRTKGHDKPHRHYDPKTFGIVAEWMGDNIPETPRQRIAGT